MQAARQSSVAGGWFPHICSELGHYPETLCCSQNTFFEYWYWNMKNLLVVCWSRREVLCGLIIMLQTSHLKS